MMKQLLHIVRHLPTKVAKTMLRKAGLSVLKENHYKRLIESSKSEYDIRFIRAFRRELSHSVIDLLSKSKSQIRQDIFALISLNMKRNGYFVEFGATDGITFSNTYLLEKEFGWTGILAEPAKVWHQRLFENRSCAIDIECVWSNTGEMVDFCETPWSEISTSLNHISMDCHSDLRRYYNSYKVLSISLVDLLQKYDAPPVIDYLSIDTEGSEYEILSSFPFDRFQFRVITCEHNHSASRTKIHSLLLNKGYTRVMEDISEFDDWYICDSQ